MLGFEIIILHVDIIYRKKTRFKDKVAQIDMKHFETIFKCN